MKKMLILSTLALLLNGCVESVALLTSTAGGASSGRLIQSSLNSAISYGVKKQTGKTPLGHAIAYAEENNPQKKKETCISFVEKTRSEFCTVIKKKISKTNTAIKKKIILVVKKTPKIKNIDKIKKSVVENVIKPVHLEEGTSKNFINNLIRLKESPRTLAIKLQAEKRNIYNNKFVNPDLFRR